MGLKNALHIIGGTVVNVSVYDEDTSAEWLASVRDDFDDILLVAEGTGGLGYTVEADGSLRPPQPFPSWTWDGGRWTAPVPYPDDGDIYVWDEDEQTWVPVTGG